MYKLIQMESGFDKIYLATIYETVSYHVNIL